MYDVLSPLRVVELASFVAGPSCGLHLLRFGAEVIRIDPLPGGPDRERWPIDAAGASLYWEGLNKGKKSVVVDLDRPEGRDLAKALVTADGEGGGLFVTNHPPRGTFAHEALAASRRDLVTCRVMGWADGRPAVDYTVNCAVGVPDMTGEPGGAPVNHVLPAWDLLAGAHAAFALVALERRRRRTGDGGEVRIPLGETAMATLADLGQVADTALTGRDRARYGNHLYGAFGRDFETADGRRVMVVALTPRQWGALVGALDLASDVAALAVELGADFSREGVRFEHRDRLAALIGSRIRGMTHGEAKASFERSGVLWGPYRSLGEAMAEEPGFAREGPLFSMLRHPSGVAYPTPGPAFGIPGLRRSAPTRAPRFGEHTGEVLAAVLGLTDLEIGRLHDRGTVHLAV